MSGANQTVPERIKQRRAQMLVHSYIYYSLGDSIVADHTWQAWANELRDLQAAHRGSIGWYDNEFRDWDGATGCHLPRDSWVINKARQLLRYRGG